MSDDKDDMFYCSFVSIHYIICECGETFPSEEDLKVHLELEHAPKKDITEYKCGICEALFSTEESCIEHFENAHVEIKTEYDDHDYVEHEYGEHDYTEIYHEEDVKPEIDVKPFITEDHQLLLNSESFRAGHQELVAHSQPYVSEDQEIILQSHPIGVEDQKITVLSEPSASELDKPKKTAKKKQKRNTKNIVCEVCGKRYPSNAALRYHQRVHTGEKPYKCTLCTKCFTMPLFLQIHIRTHTGERPYQCPLCPKAFSNKAALLRHNRVHTGAKPYECPRCGKFFTQSNSMKLHVNTVHLKMPAPYKSKTRKMKAKERERLREAIFSVIEKEETAAVKSIKAPENREPGVEYIKTEVDLYEQEVEESEIMLEGEEITYEVIYE